MSEINLLPVGLKKSREKIRQASTFNTICYGVLFLVIIALALLETANQILLLSKKSDDAQIQSLDQEIKNTSDIENKANQINQAINDLANLEKNQILWSSVLKELAFSTPPSLQINNLICDGKSSPNFKATGSASTFEDVIAFKDKLENSPYFKDVIFESATRSEKEDKISFSYTLNFNLEKKQ